MTNRAQRRAQIQSQMVCLTYGVEVEVNGMYRERVCGHICAAMEGSRIDSGRRGHGVRDSRNRRWRAVTDGSVPNGCELVSPILKGWDDMEILQRNIRALKAGGARGGSNCGIHVHVGASPFKRNPAALRRLILAVHRMEDIMREAFGTLDSRDRWCAAMKPEFYEKVNAMRAPTLENIKEAWYGTLYTESAVRQRYHHSRYRGLNLHALFNKGTVEFRYFNTGEKLHAGRVRAYVQLILAICAKALVSKSSRGTKRDRTTANAKYAMRTFMIELGLVGDYYKSVRMHLMKLLPGDAAWAKKDRRAS